MQQIWALQMRMAQTFCLQIPEKKLQNKGHLIAKTTCPTIFLNSEITELINDLETVSVDGLTILVKTTNSGKTEPGI